MTLDILSKIQTSGREKTDTLTIRLPVSIIQRLEEVSEDTRLNVSKNSLTRDLVIAGLQALEDQLNATPAPKKTTLLDDEKLSIRQRAARLFYGKEDLTNEQNSKLNKIMRSALELPTDGRAKITGEQEEKLLQYFNGNIEDLKKKMIGNHNNQIQE